MLAIFRGLSLIWGFLQSNVLQVGDPEPFSRQKRIDAGCHVVIRRLADCNNGIDLVTMYGSVDDDHHHVGRIQRCLTRPPSPPALDPLAATPRLCPPDRRHFPRWAILSGQNIM